MSRDQFRVLTCSCLIASNIVKLHPPPLTLNMYPQNVSPMGRFNAFNARGGGV